jgi:hypothetical protein
MDETHRDVLRMIGRNSEIVTFDPFRFVPGDGLWRHGQPVALPSRALAVRVRPGGSHGHARADLRIVLDWFSELASHVRPS